MTVKQAAHLLGIASGTVYALCAAGHLRHSRVGLGRGKIAISEEAINEYLKEREVGPRKPEPPPAPRSRITFQHLRFPS
jgi:excisionase family DNA binding protein